MRGTFDSTDLCVYEAHSLADGQGAGNGLVPTDALQRYHDGPLPVQRLAMCDCPRIGGVKARPETEGQAIERLTAEAARLRQRLAEERAAMLREVVTALEAFERGEMHHHYLDPSGFVTAHFNPEAE